MNEINPDKLLTTLERIAFALEKISGKEPQNTLELKASPHNSYVWNPKIPALEVITHLKPIPMNMLVGIDDQKETLLANTMQFAKGYSANNALLWGARGMGKSSLVKSIHAHLCTEYPLILIEIHREDIPTLPQLLALLVTAKDKRFILYCDDLSFDEHDQSYKSLKAVLEGGLQSRPDHILFYATSNRRHLMPRNMMENESRTAIHGGESVEEKVSLSDRFGLWLGFYPCNQEDYFKMVYNYASMTGLKINQKDLEAKALEWSMLRGSRSGRVAWQFISGLAGSNGITMDKTSFK